MSLIKATKVIPHSWIQWILNTSALGNRRGLGGEENKKDFNINIYVKQRPPGEE